MSGNNQVVWDGPVLLHSLGTSVLRGFAMMLVSMIALGCVAHQSRVLPDAITEADARQIHPRGGQYHFRQQTLTGEQSRRINALLGRPATQPGEIVTYYRVSRNVKQMTGETGTVFVEQIAVPEGTLRLIVSIRGGVAQRILVKDGPESQAIGHEFLDQFIGRDLEHSYEVSRDPEAFHRVPSPLAPIEGRWELSQRIAEAVRKILVIAEALGG